MKNNEWNAIHDGYHPEKFLGSWLSPCERFIIQQEDGYYRLLTNKIDYTKFINACNEHKDLKDAIEYCERVIEINGLEFKGFKIIKERGITQQNYDMLSCFGDIDSETIYHIVNDEKDEFQREIKIEG